MAKVLTCPWFFCGVKLGGGGGVPWLFPIPGPLNGGLGGGVPWLFPIPGPLNGGLGGGVPWLFPVPGPLNGGLGGGGGTCILFGPWLIVVQPRAGSRGWFTIRIFE